MSLNRIVSKTLPLTRRNVIFNQIRHDSVVSSTPTRRMPFPEKVIMGTIMIASTWVIPIWVLSNVTNYNSQEPKE